MGGRIDKSIPESMRGRYHFGEVLRQWSTHEHQIEYIFKWQRDGILGRIKL